MKNGILFLLVFGISSIGFGQSKIELGGRLGVSYYQGDINKSKMFYSPAMSFGGIFKFNLNKHLSVKLEGVYGRIQADDADFGEIENKLRNASFSSDLIDLSMVVEFNFLPYTSSGYIKKNNERFTPFVFLGLGANVLLSSDSFKNPVTIPFGLGIKYNIFERLTLGLDWSYRKTFNDELDGVVNVQDKTNEPIIHNDDWYAFCGIFLTYKIFRDKIKCPIY
ncbi:MAG: DUF6089 family protein [Bacteroidales bacterium]|nr:DUF6089 family protein [Bacteroidales bacterium]